MFYRLFLGCLCLTMVVGVTAQSDASCPLIANNALQQVDTLCRTLERNQACYGNITLETEVRAGIENFEFDSPGDIVDVIDIQSLRLNGMQLPDQWGVAVMRLQANLPDSLPGQNVTMLLFGDVAIESAAQSLTGRIVSSGNVNLRQKPSSTAYVIKTVSSSQALTVTGRDSAGEWLQVATDDDITGWIAAFLVEVAGDVEGLPVVDASENPIRPMQAFYFQSGVGDSPCKEVPGSGILIQTPKGTGQIEFTVNGVHLTLGSTLFLQAAPGEAMTVYVIEGEVVVSAQGISRTGQPGSVISVPVSESLEPAGIPETATAYDSEIVQSLPVDHLPEPVEIAQPYTPPPFAIGECTASSADRVPIYTQPSTDAPILITMGTWKKVYPYGQVYDENGVLWWQVNINGWVQADAFHVVEDACAELPVVDPADPQEVDASYPTRPGFVVYELEHCDTQNKGIIQPGIRVSIHLDAGGAKTMAAAHTQNAAYQPIIEVDGVAAANQRYIFGPELSKVNIGWEGWWVATPGTHVFYGCCTFMQREETCLVTVDPE